MILDVLEYYSILCIMMASVDTSPIVSTNVVEDSRGGNLKRFPFITSTSFKKEPDSSKWHPTPCVVDPPKD
jgi:hypothetical protein